MTYSFIFHIFIWTESIASSIISGSLFSNCCWFDILVLAVENRSGTLKVSWCLSCKMSKFNFVNNIFKLVGDILEKLVFTDILCSTGPPYTLAWSVPKSIFVLLKVDSMFLKIKNDWFNNILNNQLMTLFKLKQFRKITQLPLTHPPSMLP